MDVRVLDFSVLIFETQKEFLGKPPSHRKMRAWMNVRIFDFRFLIFEIQKEFLRKPLSHRTLDGRMIYIGSC